jgi:multimeric flavodoxin WrbA
MNVIGINGSPRKNGNTAILINAVFDELKKEDINTELVELSGKDVKPRIACMKCKQNKDMKYVVNDAFNDILLKLASSDGIVLGSPVYNSGVTAQMKAFTDRVGVVSMGNGYVLKRKIGASVVAAMRGGAIHAFDTLNHLFQLQQVIIVSATYWNDGYGENAANDAGGMAFLKNLGENMAWLLKKIHNETK